MAETFSTAGWREGTSGTESHEAELLALILSVLSDHVHLPGETILNCMTKVELQAHQDINQEQLARNYDLPVSGFP